MIHTTEIISAIHQIAIDHPPATARNPDWTASLKKAIRDIGEKNGYSVCPDDSDGQWLYDLIWYKNDSDGHLVELALVLESEWSRNAAHIRYDFEKLLVAKAPLKVMIFQDNGDNLDTLWHMLKEGIRRFGRQTGEIYVLAAFKEDPHVFEIQTIGAHV